MAIVSNMGRVDLKAIRGRVKIESIGRALSNYTSSVNISLMATVEDSLIWNFIATHPIESREHLERIAD
jgi:hypothetical protein